MSAEHRRQLEDVAAASYAAARAQAPGGTPVEDFLAVALPRMVAAVVDAEHYLRPPVAEVVGTPSEADGIAIAVTPPGVVVRIEYPMRMADPSAAALRQLAIEAAARRH